MHALYTVLFRLNVLTKMVGRYPLGYFIVGRWLLWVPLPGKSLKKWWSSSGQNGITWWDIFLALASLTPCHPIPCLHPYYSVSPLLFLWLIITEVPVLNILRPSTTSGCTRFEKKKKKKKGSFFWVSQEATMKVSCFALSLFSRAKPMQAQNLGRGAVCKWQCALMIAHTSCS